MSQLDMYTTILHWSRQRLPASRTAARGEQEQRAEEVVVEDHHLAEEAHETEAQDEAAEAGDVIPKLQDEICTDAEYSRKVQKEVTEKVTEKKMCSVEFYPQNLNKIEEFRKEHCENNVLKFKDKKVRNENACHIFPELEFLNEPCNPCDKNCGVTINEILNNEENLSYPKTDDNWVYHIWNTWFSNEKTKPYADSRDFKINYSTLSWINYNFLTWASCIFSILPQEQFIYYSGEPTFNFSYREKLVECVLWPTAQ